MDLITRVSEAVLEEFIEWQIRPLAQTYIVMYVDAIHVKFRIVNFILSTNK